MYSYPQIHDFGNYPYNTTAYDDRMQVEQRYRAKRNLNGLIELIDRLFDYHSRLFVVRIDIGYIQEVCQSISIEHVQRHFKQLIGDRRSYPDIFNGLVGYAWGLEYGANGGGYHYHMLLLYDGSMRRNYFMIDQSTREVWNRITGGFGRCYCSNFDEDKFVNEGHLGIGMIHRDDVRRRINLIEKVAPYITKKSSDFGIESGAAGVGLFRTFGKSQTPPLINPDVPRPGRKPVLNRSR
ncbi:MAG: inovirus-type Gp2 protein [Rhodoferax sp.]|uniref:YagK/YfjJ domain-containing protein n=1 Tax=Rhodoferax sp. TaxID=50421 RepID=UPI00260C88BA|nr:inovirus-type Gp2 protein [Rhodoferax sp.]MDD2882844.1 inovirus-type Gp2 protein [Rhodoferax sp.]